MIIFTYFETNVNPLIKIIDADFNILIVDNEIMIENYGGFYYYNFIIWNEQKNYAVIVDMGEAFVSGYRFQFASISNNLETELKIISFFSYRGSPASQLQPKISIKNKTDGILEIDAINMSELQSGFYIYNFTGYVVDKIYEISADGNDTTLDSERLQSIIFPEQIFTDDIIKMISSPLMGEIRQLQLFGEMQNIELEGEIRQLQLTGEIQNLQLTGEIKQMNLTGELQCDN